MLGQHVPVPSARKIPELALTRWGIVAVKEAFKGPNLPRAVHVLLNVEGAWGEGEGTLITRPTSGVIMLFGC